MKASGIHIGHDAAWCSINSAGDVEYYCMERHTGCKHARGLPIEQIFKAVDKSNLNYMTITQNSAGIVLSKTPFEAQTAKSIKLKQSGVNKKDTPWAQDSEYSLLVRYDESLFPSRNKSIINPLIYSDTQPYAPHLIDYTGSSELKSVHLNSSIPFLLKTQHRKIDLSIRPHHFSHAAYGYYSSPFKKALIISIDGDCAPDWRAGGFFYASPDKTIEAICPGGFWLGKFYDTVAESLGIDAGKLMGLAPYGKPIYDDLRLTGSLNYVLNQIPHEAESDYSTPTDRPYLSVAKKKKFFVIADYWLDTIKQQAKVNTLANWNTKGQVPTELQADIAASAQLILERNLRLIIKRGLHMVKERDIDGIILVGGVGLNCPSNSQLSRFISLPIWVPPACNDEGLAIGSAVDAFFRLSGRWLKASPTSTQAYIGPKYDLDDCREIFSASLKRVDSKNHIASCAKLISEGAVGCIFHGSSELGPRALGHRSITADPTSLSSWKKVNERKGREVWRPLAPMVLQEDFNNHFDSGPIDSLFMLFTHRVKHNKLPAVTHWDFSSRAQSVTRQSGIAYELLAEFKKLTGMGVLINTSLNGPGRPIAETPADAVNEVLLLNLDFLVHSSGLYINPASLSQVQP